MVDWYRADRYRIGSESGAGGWIGGAARSVCVLYVVEGVGGWRGGGSCEADGSNAAILYR